MSHNDYYSDKAANSISAKLAYWDKNQICRFANPAYLSWFGKKNDEMVNKMTLKELHGPLYKKNLPHIQSALKGKTQLFNREIPLPDGRTRHSLINYIPDIVNGKVEGFVVHVFDITHLKQIELELRQSLEKTKALATHDYLTGLPNRLLLNDQILKNIQRATRKKTKVAIGIMDLDDFKKINDTHGHHVGDAVLKEIANRSKNALREYDTISRFGGDEFVIVVSDFTKIAQVKEIANRLLDCVQKPISAENSVIHPTFSLGIALFPENGKSHDELLKNADRALYQSKVLGKNRFTFADR